MSVLNWKNNVNNAIEKIIIQEPDENKINDLAGLITIQNYLHSTDILSHSLSINPINALIDDLKIKFSIYSKTKGEYMHHPTSHNLDVELDDLDDILKVLKQIISLILQSASEKEEKEHIKSFFEPYINKFFT